MSLLDLPAVTLDDLIGGICAPSDRITLEEALARPVWMADALCREPAYAEVPFFPAKHQSAKAAQAVCGRCLVRDDCLAYAIANGIEHGVWGGLTIKARRRLA